MRGILMIITITKTISFITQISVTYRRITTIIIITIIIITFQHPMILLPQMIILQFQQRILIFLNQLPIHK